MTPQFQPERYGGRRGCVADATRVRVLCGKSFSDMHTRDGGGDGGKNYDRKMVSWLGPGVHAGCWSWVGGPL